MVAIENILNKYGQVGVQLLKNAISELRATGKTERSLRYEVEEEKGRTTLKIYGREFFKALETGRKPAEQSGPPGFPERLEEYMQARGFQSKVSKKGVKYWRIGDNWYSGKSLAYKINTQGDRTYRTGGRQVYSDDLSKFVEELKREVKDAFLFTAPKLKVNE
jgi:hypothetical protein